VRWGSRGGEQPGWGWKHGVRASLLWPWRVVVSIPLRFERLTRPHHSDSLTRSHWDNGGEERRKTRQRDEIARRSRHRWVDQARDRQRRAGNRDGGNVEGGHCLERGRRAILLRMQMK
jgi:hypothetical protein